VSIQQWNPDHANFVIVLHGHLLAEQKASLRAEEIPLPKRTRSLYEDCTMWYYKIYTKVFGKCDPEYRDPTSIMCFKTVVTRASQTPHEKNRWTLRNGPQRGPLHSVANGPACYVLCTAVKIGSRTTRGVYVLCINL
jgi:hypothetical protein